MELEALNDSEKAISAQGASPVLLSPDTIANNQAIAKQKYLSCEIL